MTKRQIRERIKIYQAARSLFPQSKDSLQYSIVAYLNLKSYRTKHYVRCKKKKKPLRGAMVAFYFCQCIRTNCSR